VDGEIRVNSPLFKTQNTTRPAAHPVALSPTLAAAAPGGTKAGTRKINAGENQATADSKIPPSAEAKITDFLKLTAEKYIRQRVPQLAAQMGLTGAYRRISLKKQSTRWGSCSSDKNLNFNWTLVYYAPEVIDYVLMHELAHLVHMNHSVEFWRLVRQYDPLYKQHKKVLNG
jgi:predicted metal-dependent hydrolase